MPRVYTQKAAKDYPNEGIVKGSMYYRWTVRTSPYSSREFKSATYPRPSQLNFGFRGQLGDIEQDMSKAESPEELKSFADTLRGLGEEQQEKLDNMPEGLQQGSTGELLSERAEGLSSWADEVEQAADEWETAFEELKTLQQAWADYDVAYAEYESEQSAYDDADDQDDLEEPVEPDEPDEERPGEEAEDELRSQYVEQAESANPGL